jgi:hypothetical protein
MRLVLSISDMQIINPLYEGRPESEDHLAIKKNTQNKNFNVSLLQTLSYFPT